MEYDTWYEFKKDCEERLGSPISNRTWLRVKPKAPFPWNDTDKVVVLSRINRLRNSQRQKSSSLSSITEPDSHIHHSRGLSHTH